MAQNIGFVLYQIRTYKLLLFKYCTQPIFCGLDAITDKYNCCRNTAVCIGDRLLNFSVPELVRSQSTFSTDPEVLQNCAGSTLWNSAGLAVRECSVVMGLAPCMLCVQICCVLCVWDYYLLNSEL